MNKQILLEQLIAFKDTLVKNSKEGRNTHWSIGESLNSIRELIFESLGAQDKATFDKIVSPIAVERPDATQPGPYTLSSQDGLRLCTQLLPYINQKEPADEIEKLISPLSGSDTALMFDVAIVCALHDPELKAVLDLSKWVQLQTLPGDPQTYYTSTWKSKAGKMIKLVAAAPNYMGLVSSAALATKLALRFRPRLLVMVGIAAGTKSDKQGFGDILAPDQTFDYGSSKTIVDNGVIRIEPNPNPLPISAKILGRLKIWQFERTGLDDIAKNWPAKLPSTQLRLHIGPLFSSPTVLDATQPVQDINKHWRKLIGVEMEAYGVHRACYDSIEPPPQFLCLKSICDFASAKNDDWQHYAAYTSAQLLKYFLLTEWASLAL